MKIVRVPKMEAWTLEATKAWLQARPRAKGVHVSDLLTPRKGYWKVVDPRPMTDAEAGYFVAGLGHHAVIEGIIGKADHSAVKNVLSTDAGAYEWRGIHYSPDVLTPHPLEIKTSRSRYGPKSQSERSLLVEYEHYLKQLRAYCAIRGDGRGDLLVFYLNLENKVTKKTTPTFQWYTITLTPEEIGKIQADLLAGKTALAKAIKTKKHRPLPLCPEWLCRGCQWIDKCTPWDDDPRRKSLQTKNTLRLVQAGKA